MRAIDKKINLKNANILAEQRYIESKKMLNEIGSIIDIDGVTDSLVNTTLKTRDDSFVYLMAKKTLADSDNKIKHEFYTVLAKKMDANNLTSQAQTYRMLAQQYQSDLKIKNIKK